MSIGLIGSDTDLGKTITEPRLEDLPRLAFAAVIKTALVRFVCRL